MSIWYHKTQSEYLSELLGTWLADLIIINAKNATLHKPQWKSIFGATSKIVRNNPNHKPKHIYWNSYQQLKQQYLKSNIITQYKLKYAKRSLLSQERCCTTVQKVLASVIKPLYLYSRVFKAALVSVEQCMCCMFKTKAAVKSQDSRLMVWVSPISSNSDSSPFSLRISVWSLDIQFSFALSFSPPSHLVPTDRLGATPVYFILLYVFFMAILFINPPAII